MAKPTNAPRPVVLIRPASRSDGSTSHVVWCQTADCQFVYVAAVKTDAQDQARYHREHHRKDTTNAAVR